jgi:hypothetical protein
MAGKYQDLLDIFYHKNGIHPEDFRCQHQDFCRRAANNGNMTETKMSLVGSLFGEEYPKIVVVSLDPPSGKKEDGTTKRWDFITPHQRTTEYVSSTHEKDNYTVDHANQHWAMTQIIVKDLLELYGYRAQPHAATVCESYSGHPIENVSAYFAHVNVAKCSMNNSGQRQAAEAVHITCSTAYLLGELRLLEPDILITQGAITNEIMGKMLIGREVLINDLPMVVKINLGGRHVIWMPMRHPVQQLKQIRDKWPDYLNQLKKII